MLRKDHMPLMVYAALLGIGNRRAAMLFVWAGVAIAVIALLSTAVLIVQADWAMSILPFVACFGFLGSSWWYWYAIRWVDTHSSW